MQVWSQIAKQIYTIIVQKMAGMNRWPKHIATQLKMQPKASSIAAPIYTLMAIFPKISPRRFIPRLKEVSETYNAKQVHYCFCTMILDWEYTYT